MNANLLYLTVPDILDRLYTDIDNLINLADAFRLPFFPTSWIH